MTFARARTAVNRALCDSNVNAAAYFGAFANGCSWRASASSAAAQTPGTRTFSLNATIAAAASHPTYLGWREVGQPTKAATAG